MIVFKKLRYKNFLSTGTQFTEIDFTETTSTLVVGQNGSGKSTMLDALSFALFGKAHRPVNKPQLVNSVNNKDCVVVVEFDALGQQFKVVRGIKPAKFEIWQGNKMINQDSHAKEYQKVLEQNILKLNHKSFHQIVVLGSSSFIPFMQLPAQHRREVIEDLLDINVFSKMNTVLKEKIAMLKESITRNAHDIELVDTEINSQKKHITELEKISETARAEKESELETQMSELVRLENLLDDEITLVVQQLQEDLAKVNKEKTQLEKFQFQFDSKTKKFDKDIAFYEDNDTCPTCDQEITSDTKDRKIEESREQKREIEKAGGELQNRLSCLVEKEKKIATDEDEAQSKKYNQDNYRSSIRETKERIQSLRDDLGKLANMDSLQTAKTTLEDLLSSREEAVDRKLQLATEREYNNVITELLKDSGIKTKIIKQYLPVINKLTNQYLQVLDFYVHFDLDEGFNETIRSRHRDAFSYASFSEGEKQRIDLALLFTWRQVAKMKNSVATNLLILDETFDSSLDADGVDNLSKILETLGTDTNVFIISHKGEMLDNKFDRKIEFVKSKNFSKVA